MRVVNTGQTKVKRVLYAYLIDKRLPTSRLKSTPVCSKCYLQNTVLYLNVPHFVCTSDNTIDNGNRN